VVETLRADEEFALRRARRDGELSTFLLLVPVSEYPSLASLARLEQEYSLRDELDPDWAIRPLALSGHGGQTALILEDPGAEALERFIGQPMELGRFLRFAICLTAGLGKLHRRGFIHKDIRPANILVDSATNKVWLTGFGIASRLPREHHAAEPPEVLAGTLPYMAPEQTGRMNRSIDSRSDLYSVGVTLYQMLTGVLPFQASDPMEWIHCHIARQPPKPCEQSERIPESISGIVMKLLAKSAEERYQTAAGLEADLRKCLLQWEPAGRIEPFPLGQQDLPDQLLISEKIYGRQHECQSLLDAFDRVAASGKPELVLVSGCSGIGKSSLIHELQKVIVLPRGIFISGKFDQNKRDVPYATLTQAFQTLALHIVSKSKEEVIHWRNTILKAVGSNGRLMVNLIPELELIIGEQPPVLELPPQDAQRRFQLVLRRFIGLFARRKHPLVLFLDDLQWLDIATLDLLEDLLTRPDVNYLILVGAYRDDEIDSAHPLMRRLEAIRRAGASVHEITLAPLSCDDLRPLIADSLHCEPERATALAELVYEKTAGNPFFATQFLSALAEEGLLTFNHGDARWSWDLNRIRAKGYTKNVVDLMIGKLNRLPAETLNVMQQLACLGNSAEITTLSIVQETSEEEVHSDLWEAVRQDLIVRLERSYKFIHDRVREAAYSLIPEELRAEAHLRIGRLLAAHTPAEKREEAIFEIVNPLNRGAALITSRGDREELAELNLIAGKRAKAATAYASALKYLSIGAALLPRACWGRGHELAFALEYHRAECEFLTGNLTEAEQRLSMLSRRAGNLADRAAVTCLRVNLFTTQDRCDRSVQIGLKFLRSVDVSWPRHPTKDEIRQEFQRIWQQLGSRSVAELIDLPLMTDSGWQARMNVLTMLLPPALFTDENLFCLIVARMANISLERGNSDGSCLAYVWLGLLLGPHFNNYKAAFEFGQLGRDLVEKRALDRFRARVYLDFSHVVNPWKQHARFGPALVRRAFDAANELGDLTFAAYSSCNLVSALLATGDPLADVQSEAEKQLQFARKARFGLIADIITGQLRLVLQLRGLTPTFSSFNGPNFDEHDFERGLDQDPGGAVATAWYWVRKLQGRVFADDRPGALEAAAKVAQFLWTIPSHLEVAEYHFYGALARAAYYDTASSNTRPSLLQALRAHHKQLELWAQHCSENFANRVALAAAEIARLEGRQVDAELLYEQAIRSAGANGFVHHEALANELAGRFYAARGLEKIAHVYLRDSRYCYLRWGALGKVQQLEQRYPALAEQSSPRTAVMIGTSVEQLDLGTVMKASQAISTEIVIEKLLGTLMTMAVEHAGAERGLLILQRGGEHRIAAEARPGSNGVEVQLRQALITPAALPESLLLCVLQTQRTVILDDASSQSLFSEDPYILEKRPRSVLCLPLLKQGKLIGALYLENNLAPRVFTPKRLAVSELLASQAAISLDHARLYAELTQENSDRKKAEEALRASEERLQDIVDNTTAVIFVKDLELRYVLVNRAFERRHQVQRDQICGKTDFDIHPPEVAESVRANDRRVIEAGAPIQFEEAVPSIEGERWFVAVKFLLRDRFEKPYAVCGIATDITESKRAQEMQAAMARERDMLAQQRATQLATANNALRGCLDALASVPELDDFLGQVMAAITSQLSAVSSTLRLYDFEKRALILEFVVQENRVIAPAEAGYPKDLQSISLDNPRLTSWLQSMTVSHLADPQAAIPDVLRSHLLARGVRTLLIIPLISAERPMGCLMFRFAQERDFNSEELEIARALAAQASLAIQLTRLAKTAKQSAVLEERNRLAGEIHDSLAQNFAGISMQLSVAAGATKRKSKDALSHVERAIELARFGLSEARRSALSLRSNVIEESGLTEALHRLVERSNIPGLLSCSFRSSRVHEQSLTPQVQQDLLRIAQEAISNAIRHAQPTVINVSLRWSPPSLVLKVTDNGSGFDRARRPIGSEGFGFASMRARAKNLGAELDIHSTPGSGTSVIVRLAQEPPGIKPS